MPRIDLADEARQFLRKRLPDYMLPQQFIPLGNVPLTSNGKVDRKALPPPEVGEVPIRQYEAPRGTTESALVGVWQALLQRERIGRHDNFFDLGGNSVLLVRMHGLLADTFQRSVPIVDLFRHPTIEKLARALDGVMPEATAPDDRGLDRGRNRRESMRKRTAARRSLSRSDRPMGDV